MDKRATNSHPERLPSKERTGGVVARNKQVTTAVGAVASTIDRAELEAEAKRVGVVERSRKFDIAAFVWSLVLGFSGGRQRRLAALHRSYNSAARVPLSASAWREWFTAEMLEVLKGLAVRALTKLNAGTPKFVGILAKFRDVVAIDSVVIRLRDELQKLYPACRTNHTKAAAKMHTVLSITGHSESRVKITSERVNDRTPLRRVGRWVAGNLLLVDLGYFSYWLFHRIDENKGWFISRLKEGVNPLIVDQNRRWRGASVRLLGQRLRDVADRLKRQVVDVVAEVDVTKRKYNGRARRTTKRFRLIGVYNKSEKAHHWYLTNVPPEVLSPQEVSMLYAARWLVELLFRELTLHHRLKDMPSPDPLVVESLIYGSVLALVANHRVVVYLKNRERAEAARFAIERAAAVLAEVNHMLLLVIVRRSARKGLPARWLDELILRGVRDPHRTRRDLAMRVDSGTQLSYLAAAQEAALAA
jgi:putative transposase